MIHYFQRPIDKDSLPELFNNPFDYIPHPLCIEAAQEVQAYIEKMNFWTLHPNEGKMFGVLVIRTPEDKIGYLAAFSGIFNGSYIHPYFVPPIYNLQDPNGFFQQEESYISAYNKQIEDKEKDPIYIQAQEALQVCQKQASIALSKAQEVLKEEKLKREWKRTYTQEDPALLIRESQYQKAEYKRLQKAWQKQIEELQTQVDLFAFQIEEMKIERKKRSAQLQQKLFEQFLLRNACGEEKNVYTIFQEENLSNPPAGSGECAAPKLLQYAYLHHLQPIAMAEFWWGTSPKTEIRKQGYYYPACTSKCGPILRFMLQGLYVAQRTSEMFQCPEIIYEDDVLLVVNKMAGTLSVPGKTNQQSIYSWARKRYPQATGPLLVHRLDMATSGLVLIAKEKNVHKHLQQQFLHHQIQKRYIALLDGSVKDQTGIINLPLCSDIQNRPRQMVHPTLGKPAITHYQVIQSAPPYTRIALFPQTGRTHQLRVHAAHSEGLNCPILGDSLYGKSADRLYLHAEYIRFIHPISMETLSIEKKADF